MMKDSYDVSYINDGFDEKGDSKEKAGDKSAVTLRKVVSIDETAIEARGSKSVDIVKDIEDPERPQWDNQCEFIL